ncbi:MAG: hypothetical protein HZB40_04540 [Rhodocyclales bacterium]|nr:hypothetical protein [Rhodocyclales bacterium]
MRTPERAIALVLFEAKPREHEKVPRQRPFDAESDQQLLAIGGFGALVAAMLLASP